MQKLVATTRKGHVMHLEDILVAIIDGHYRHAAIGELQKDVAEEFSWMCDFVRVYYTIHWDEMEMFTLEWRCARWKG